MLINDIWMPYIQPSKELESALPQAFKVEINEAYRVFKKDPEQFIRTLEKRQEGITDKDTFHLSLPRRKRYLGNVPLGFEIALLNTPAELQQRIVEKLALSDLSIGNIAHDITVLPDIKRFLQTVYDNAPLSGSNLGIYAHACFHSRFEMTGAPIFSLDDKLYQELCDTDISKKTPCEFLRTPMPMLYLEFGQKRNPDLPLCWHEQSGWHCMEGAYLNTFTLTEEELIRECEDSNLKLGDITLPHNKYNVISHGLATGFIKKDGGDVQVMEILVSGSPLGKEHLLDDSSHQFVLIVQDRDMDVSDMLDWHLRYNRRELETQREMQDTGHTDHLPLRHVHRISDNEAKTIENTVHAITKALLYINSETCIQEKVNVATEHKKALARTQNKAKIRKLAKRGRALSDYILITLPKGTEDGIAISDPNKKGSKSTHWRRAHFHTFRYGEGRKKMRVKWVGRTLINATSGLAKNKEYKVK